MAKEIVLDDSLYNRIKDLAEKKNLKIDDLLNYLVMTNEINGVEFLTDDFSKFKNILIEDTGLFDYKGGQSGIYNRLKESNINTLQDLFQKYSLKKIEYGANIVADKNYIYNEMNGIISLLSYEYLNKESLYLNECLNTEINAHYMVKVSDYPTGYPGEIFKAVILKNYPRSVAYNDVNNMLMLFKSCGFNLTCCKALIDYAYSKKIKSEKLGEFLNNIDIDEIKPYFNKVTRNYIVFLNINNILTKYYKNVFCEDKKTK